jgi:hypothetical protein
MSFTISKLYKYHYLKVVDKKTPSLVIARVDVSHLNKKGITLEWDRIDSKYPTTRYISTLESRNDEVACFENETSE